MLPGTQARACRFRQGDHRMNRKGRFFAFALLTLSVMTTTSATADDAADRCGAAKLKAAGRYGQALLTCNSTSTRRNETVDSLCVGKAAGKLDGAIQKAE